MAPRIDPAPGDQLRRARLAAGHTQGEFADRIYYHKAYLSRVENGQRPLTKEMATAVDKVLGTGGRFGELIRGDRPEPGRDRRHTGCADELLAGFTERFLAARRLGQHVEPGRILSMVGSDLEQLTALEDTVGPEGWQRVQVLKSRYSEYLGWMAQEYGDIELTRRLTRQAVRQAQAGGDESMAPYARVRLALVALYANDGEQSIALARQAFQHDGASPRVRALAVMREGQGHALAGRATEFHRAFDRADELFSRVEPQSGIPLGSSDPGSPTALVRGWSLYHLGQHRSSAQTLEDELADIDPGRRRHRSRYAVRCALAHLAAGELERACELTADLLPALLALRSATIRTDVTALAAGLTGYGDHPPAARLRRELSELLTAGSC